MRTVIAIILLILIITLGIYEQSFVNRTFEDLENKTNEIKKTLEDNDYDGALTLINSTFQWWDKKSQTLEMMASHVTFKEVAIYLADLKGQIIVQDKDQAISVCYILFGICENYNHFLGFHIEHIL